MKCNTLKFNCKLHTENVLVYAVVVIIVCCVVSSIVVCSLNLIAVLLGIIAVLYMVMIVNVVVVSFSFKVIITVIFIDRNHCHLVCVIGSVI